GIPPARRARGCSPARCTRSSGRGVATRSSRCAAAAGSARGRSSSGCEGGDPPMTPTGLGGASGTGARVRDPGPWHPVTPTEAAPWFADVRVAWWIAGGWALDLFLERQTREHGDLDVGVLRRDVEEVLRALRGWEIFEARDGALARLPSGA